jgi:hypothetical protein
MFLKLLQALWLCSARVCSILLEDSLVNFSLNLFSQRFSQKLLTFSERENALVERLLRKSIVRSKIKVGKRKNPSRKLQYSISTIPNI